MYFYFFWVVFIVELSGATYFLLQICFVDLQPEDKSQLLFCVLLCAIMAKRASGVIADIERRFKSGELKIKQSDSAGGINEKS